MRSLLVFITAALALPASAADTSYDFTVCTHGQHTMVEASADLVALGIENWGVVAASTTKDWEGATTHCTGYVRVMGGKPVGKGVCKWFLAAGETAVGEFEYPPAGEPSFTWLAGTGRLKGLTGSGSFRELFDGKPAAPGTAQGCRRDWGRYSTPGAK